MIRNKTITLILPCKNEEEGLKALLTKVPSFIDEVIVIDNGSKDKTSSIARKFGAKVIKEKRNKSGIGYGFAHQAGLIHAKGDYIVAMDGDDTYPIRGLINIISYMQDSGIDFLSCNRLPLKHPKAISFLRQLGILILNFEVALLYGYTIKDILSGMYIVKRNILKELHITSGNWNFSPEIKIAAIQSQKVKFQEYHIDHYYRSKGQSKLDLWRTGWEHSLFILKGRIFKHDVEYVEFAKILRNQLSFTVRTALSLFFLWFFMFLRSFFTKTA